MGGSSDLSRGILNLGSTGVHGPGKTICFTSSQGLLVAVSAALLSRERRLEGLDRG